MRASTWRLASSRGEGLPAPGYFIPGRDGAGVRRLGIVPCRRRVSSSRDRAQARARPDHRVVVLLMCRLMPGFTYPNGALRQNSGGFDAGSESLVEALHARLSRLEA